MSGGFAGHKERPYHDLPGPKGTQGELQRDLGERPGRSGQREVASHYKRAEFDGILGRNFWLGGW